MSGNTSSHDSIAVGKAGATTGTVYQEDVTSDQDLAPVITAELQHLTEFTPEEKAIEKRLVRIMDLRILPLMITVYLMNYIDRNNYAAARLQGLQKDLKLKGNQYQIGLSILFVGYVLMQVPSNMLLNYSGRPSWYLGFFITSWGLVSLLTSQVNSFGGLVACRFVLGLVEAPFFAGALFYLSKWYTKTELSLRMAIFYSGSLLSGAFGSLLAAGILKGLAGVRGMSAWRWLFIIEGSITMFVGILVILFLPDFPNTWKALDGEKKAIAIRRLAIDAGSADVDEGGSKSQIEGMKMAFADPKTYLFAIMYHAIAVAGGFQYFFPTLTATLGYTHFISLLLVAPPYVFMVIWSLGHSIVSDKIKHRFWFWMYPQPIVLIGFIIFMTTESFGARYFSFFCLIFIFALNGILYAWISNAIPRPPAKRSAAFAFINSFANTASIWTPFTYYESESPQYRVANGISIGALVISMTCAIILNWYTKRQNKELDRLESEHMELDRHQIDILHKTADFVGVDMSMVRKMQKRQRYML